MLDKLLGIVLQDVVDGKGERLGRNIRPVLAAEFQVIGVVAGQPNCAGQAGERHLPSRPSDSPHRTSSTPLKSLRE
jgi:hypothetical protein